MWWCHGLGWGGLTVGSSARSSGQTRSLVFFAQSFTNPPGTAAPASRRSQDIQGLSPRCWSEGASDSLQRSLWGRRMGSRAVPMENSYWERGLLAVCLMRLYLMELGKRALLGRTLDRWTWAVPSRKLFPPRSVCWHPGDSELELFSWHFPGSVTSSNSQI